ncbi:hypothetical protein HOC37_07525 [bacterium]|nr:hypothetical protein [bacterium]MBT4552807.1 hypothetical protein [bacterium]MBT7088106.1 hypothetical protein [bacterium]
MNKTYIVLLKNSYLLFFAKKPKKKGSYTNEVRLFETEDKTTCQDVRNWVEKKYKLPIIKEVADWE